MATIASNGPSGLVLLQYVINRCLWLRRYSFQIFVGIWLSLL